MLTSYNYEITLQKICCLKTDNIVDRIDKINSYCTEHFGPRHLNWTYTVSPSLTYVDIMVHYYFKDEEDALLFKLRFGELIYD